MKKRIELLSSNKQNNFSPTVQATSIIIIISTYSDRLQLFRMVRRAIRSFHVSPTAIESIYRWFHAPFICFRECPLRNATTLRGGWRGGDRVCGSWRQRHAYRLSQLPVAVSVPLVESTWKKCYRRLSRTGVLRYGWNLLNCTTFPDKIKWR